MILKNRIISYIYIVIKS